MRTFKSLLALCFGAVALAAMVSCERDLYEDQLYQQHLKPGTTLLKGKEASEAILRLNNLLSQRHFLDNGAQGRLSEDLGTIKYDEILRVIDSLGNVNFTFRVDHPESSDLKFFNLVMKEKSGGSIVKLMEYTMTEDFAQLYAQTFRLENFRGQIRSEVIINTTDCPDPIYDISIGAVGSDGGGGGNNPPPSGEIPQVWPEPSDIVIVFYPAFASEEWIEVSQSPRYFRMSLGFEQADGSDDCIKEIQGVLIPVDECTKSVLSFLNSAERAWLYQNDKEYDALLNFITSSMNCDDARHYAQQLVQNLMSGAEMLDVDDLDEQIITTLPPCLGNVVNDIKNVPLGGFSGMLQNFVGTNPFPLDYHWLLDTGSLPLDKAAETNPTLGPGGIATTILNNHYLNISTDLSWAKTIMHEAFHAYLVSVFRDPTITDKTYANLVNLYYHQFNSNLNDTHHHIFANTNIIQEISTALQQFGIMRGYNLPQQFYDDMAWGGLAGTDAFENLPLTDQVRINSVIGAEFYNVPINGYLPQGHPVCP